MSRAAKRVTRAVSSMVAAALALAGAAALVPAAALAQASPSAFTSATRYDAMGRVTGTIAPDPDGAGPRAHLAVRNTYDESGRLVRVENGELAGWQGEAVAPASWTGFTIFQTLETRYDAMGRKTHETVGAGGTLYALTQYSYDSFGNLECTAVRMDPSDFAALLTTTDACAPTTPAGPLGADRITQLLYDEAGQLVQERRAHSILLREQAYATYAYNDNGQRTTLIDANGNRSEFRYDGHGRLSCWILPSTAGPATFDPTSPATVLDTAGDANGDCASLGDFERYEYDANGNRTSLRKRDGSTITFHYDSLNRLTSKVVPERSGLSAVHTRDVYYGYDLRGLQTSARFDSQAGEGVTNTYDGFGRLVSSTADLGGHARTLSHIYDRNGNRLQLTHPDGNWFSLDYDGLNRLIRISENSAGCANACRWLAHFWYDQQGRREQVMRGSNGNPLAYTYSTYAYDPIGRLQGLDHAFSFQPSMNVATSFTYNPAGQIVGQTRDNDFYAWPARTGTGTGHYNVSRPYEVNGLNQYTAAGPPGSQVAYDYDDNGNLVSDGTRTYVYDVENRLVSAGVINLTYDPLGRLFETSGAGAVTTQYVYDGDALVLEYGASNQVLRRYVHGPGVDEPLVNYEGPTVSWDQRRWLQADRQGSIVAAAGVWGNVYAANSYDEYGIPGPQNWGRFQFTGQTWLSEIGLFYYKARIYSPTLGRFLQTDPVGYEDQVNLYVYVGNDPVNGDDPTGTCWEPGCPEPERSGDTLQQLADLATNTINGTLHDLQTFSNGVLNPSPETVVPTFIAAVTLGLTVTPVGPEVRAATLPGGAVRAYQSGTYAELKAASRTGDRLDVHHAPQAHVAAQVSPGYSRNHGPAIVLPRGEHQRMPTVRGTVSMTPRSMLAQEARNLRTFTRATNQQIRSWLQTAKSYFGID